MNRWRVNAFKRVIAEYLVCGVPEQDIAALIADLAADGPCDLYTLRVSLDRIVPTDELEMAA